MSDFLRQQWNAGATKAFAKFGASKHIAKPQAADESEPVDWDDLSDRASLAGGGALLASEAPRPFLGMFNAVDRRIPKIDPETAFPSLSQQLQVPHQPTLALAPHLPHGYMHNPPSPDWMPGESPERARAGSRSIVMAPGPSSEAILAHELGHAKIHQSLKGLPSTIRGITTPVSMATSPLAGAYALAAEDPSYIPALAHLGINVPTLLDESAANALSLRHMIRTHGWKQGLRNSASLFPAMGTYVANATAPLALTALKKKYHQWRHPQSGDQG
jgi:hypothetical protein